MVLSLKTVQFIKIYYFFQSGKQSFWQDVGHGLHHGEGFMEGDAGGRGGREEGLRAGPQGV